MKKLLWMLTLVLLPFSLQAQISEVTTALENNDAEGLGAYFMNTVELEIESTEGMYAKAQAKVMVRDFFTKIRPATFTLKHKSDSGSSKYIIGDLTSKGQRWRVTAYFRREGSSDLIQTLKFEKE